MPKLHLSPVGVALLLVVAAAMLILVNGLVQWRGGAVGASRGVRSLETRRAPLPPTQPAPSTATLLPGHVEAAAPTATIPPSSTVAPPMPTPPPSTPTPLYQPPQPTVALTGFHHAWQSWNNCGPATLAMNLSYYGSLLDQAAIGGELRTHEDDKNVSPEELAAFAQAQGFQAQVRINGNMDLLRTLLSNGLPVLIETWLIPEPNDGMGHYRLLTGYSDADRSWIAYDSYVSASLLAPDGPYQGIRLDYAETDQLWEVFNRTYLLIYPAAQSQVVQAILGDAFDPQHMWQNALLQAQESVQQHDQESFAWFNLGTDLLAVGRYAEAVQAYDRARQLGLPWRMLWYQYGPFQAYYAIGRFADVVELAESTLATTSSIEELHYWRGWGLAGAGNLPAARQAWQQALALNPNFTPASQALANAP
jgi:hypothetical protein